MPLADVSQHPLALCPVRPGHFAFGVRSARLATAAMGLGGMFVLQTSSANLFAMREQIVQGLACREPALFSVYAAPSPTASGLPPYLLAAAAMQSRAFPAFCYDAAAGHNWATRFSLANYPQPGDDWSTEDLRYADAALQRAQDRHHTGELLVAGHRFGAGPRGLATDVDDVCAVGFHAQRGSDSGRRIAEVVGVAEGIRGDVEDSHHQATSTQKEPSLAGKRNRVGVARGKFTIHKEAIYKGNPLFIVPCKLSIAYSCGSGLFSDGTIGARSFTRARGSSSSTAARAATGGSSSSGRPAASRLT